MGTSEANHCWKGFAVNTPSEVNQREKGAVTFEVVVFDGFFFDAVVMVSW